VLSGDRLKEVAAELEAREAAEANAKNEETDSDDDVQFIASSFDPEVAAKNQRYVSPTGVCVLGHQDCLITLIVLIPHLIVLCN
jgi:hypothetical protein